jgi:hypothetical protein
VTDAELRHLTNASVVGFRFSRSSPTATTAFEDIEPMTKRVAALGWQIRAPHPRGESASRRPVSQSETRRRYLRLTENVPEPNPAIRIIVLISGALNMTEYSELAPRERVKRYRELAREAEKMAANSRNSVRESYLVMADQWRKLADEVEASCK